MPSRTKAVLRLECEEVTSVDISNAKNVAPYFRQGLLQLFANTSDTHT
jgi:hypothetical protein